MKKIYLLLALFLFAGIAHAAPVNELYRSLIPEATDQYYVGTSSPSTLEYNGIFTKNLTVSGTCTGCGGGGSSIIGTVSTSSTPTRGQLSYWTTSGAFPELLGSIGTSSVTINAPLTTAGTIGALIGGTALTIGCQTASGSQAGCLSSTDWSTFNSKGSGTVTQVNTTWPVIGGPFTTTGTLSFGGLSTSSPIAAGAALLYATGVNTLASTATSTLTGTGPISVSNAPYIIGASGAVVSCATASGSVAGCLAAADFSKFNSATTTFSAPLVYTSGTNAVTCTNASSGVTGCLTGTDWNTFNGKGSGTLTSLTAGDGLLGGIITTSGMFYAQLGTSSTPVLGQIPYWSVLGTATSPAKLTSIATSSISLSAGLTNTGTLGSQIGGSALTLKQIENRSFSYATSTAWTGTTTIPLEVGYGEVWNNVQCFTDTGTLNVDFYYNSTHIFNPVDISASTTVGTWTSFSNSTPTSGSKVKVDIGTPVSSPTQIVCKVNDTI